jgi:phosphoglycerate dehydrogenase-like enzyme
MKKKAAFFNNKGWQAIDHVYGNGRREKVVDMTEMYSEPISNDNFEEHVDKLQNIEVIFSTWGMGAFSEEQIERLPALKAVFYAAGATDGFARPFLNENIIVASAWLANAIPVAEFCVGQILLALNGFFRNTRDCSNPATRAKAYRGNGIFEETVVLIGAGAIAQKTKELLESYNIEVIIIPSRAERRTISLEEAFSKAYVVSNHLPNRSDNIGVLNADLFRSMPFGGTFINTGRGAQVNEDDLVEVMKERPDLTALLDVTHPEPPLPDSKLYNVPNIQLSSHIAGSMNNEVVRMADYMIEEFIRWDKGEKLKYQISENMLLTSASSKKTNGDTQAD